MKTLTATPDSNKTVAVPEISDPPNPALFEPPFQALLDRFAYLQAQIVGDSYVGGQRDVLALNAAGATALCTFALPDGYLTQMTWNILAVDDNGNYGYGRYSMVATRSGGVVTTVKAFSAIDGQMGTHVISQSLSGTNVIVSIDCTDIGSAAQALSILHWIRVPLV